MSKSTTFSVVGMTCSHCVASVTEELMEIPGVIEVGVSLERGEVKVLSEQPITNQRLSEAVTNAGYQLVTESST
jgi:copper chaperone